ncbi:MAG: 16S rRNA (cytidine(1402)-2'-O)-methyltransferase [Clostridia bacterium]
MSGKLYLVATPIGNLEDITLRAIQILKEVDLIAAEDTRHTLGLLNHLEISKPLISYHRHNEEVKTDILIEKLKEGENIALVSDAGTPVISDPGEEVVKTCIKENIEVIPIPGACAAINALIASGLNAKRFEFMGFLSLNKKIRKQELEEIKEKSQTVILYEAPHKINNTLEDLEQIIPERNLVIAKELTKIHETFYRGTPQELQEKLENPKGEFIILIEGKKQEEKLNDFLTKLSLKEHYQYYEQQGLKKKEIIKKIAKDRNVSKNEIYQKFI